MIIVKITGGLGNQLFQYAFGQYLSYKLKTKVLYDVDTIKNIKGFTSRTLELLNFNLELDFATVEDVKTMRYFTDGILSRIERKLTQRIPSINNKYIVWKSIHKLIPIDLIRDNCYYDSYWQCTEYANYPRIFNENQINLTPKLNIKDDLLLNKIINSESISIHIRRGDYISIKKNNDIYHICDMEYYTSAINYIKSKCSKPLFFVFSDDIEWAKENFIGDDFVYVHGNEPAQDMYLMSFCKHNIIANSTFSWWGAWLNKSNSKMIIAPAKWYKDENDNNNLETFISRNWIRL